MKFGFVNYRFVGINSLNIFRKDLSLAVVFVM